MFTNWKNGLLALTLGSSFLAAGCQTGGNHAMASHEMAPNAVMCDACKITWVQERNIGAKGRIIGYTSRQVMECPDCKDAVTNFFTTGNLKHECKACGGNMTICAAH